MPWTPRDALHDIAGNVLSIEDAGQLVSGQRLFGENVDQSDLMRHA
jgi:hypothetical protein